MNLQKNSRKITLLKISLTGFQFIQRTLDRHGAAGQDCGNGCNREANKQDSVLVLLPFGAVSYTHLFHQLQKLIHIGNLPGLCLDFPFQYSGKLLNLCLLLLVLTGRCV